MSVLFSSCPPPLLCLVSHMSLVLPKGFFLLKQSFYLPLLCVGGVRPWVSVKHLETVLIVTDAV